MAIEKLPAEISQSFFDRIELKEHEEVGMFWFG